MSNRPPIIFDELKVHPTTKLLVVSLFFDLPLTPVERCDFGVDTDTHYRALQVLLYDGPIEAEEGMYDLRIDYYDEEYQKFCIRVMELNEARRDGAKLTALVRKYAPHYAQLHFYTSSDDFLGRTDEESPDKR
jgi:hypothetical protein